MDAVLPDNPDIVARNLKRALIERMEPELSRMVQAHSRDMEELSLTHRRLVENEAKTVQEESRLSAEKVCALSLVV
jgi:hypothetical protein